MASCKKCGKELYMPFVCSYCGESYCSEHRLPETHNCSDLIRGSEHARPTPPAVVEPVQYYEPPPRSTQEVPFRDSGLPEIDENDIPPDADDYEEFYDPETGETIVRYYVYDRSGFRKFFLPVPKLTKPNKPIFGITSKWEVLELGLSTVLMALIAWTLFYTPLQAMAGGNWVIDIMLIVIPVAFATLGFLGHELAHKFASIKLGHWSEFRFLPFFLTLTIISFILSIVGFFAPQYAIPFKFMLPGAVMVPPRAGESKHLMGKIAIAGPVFNCVVSSILLPIIIILPPALPLNNFSFLVVGLTTGALMNIMLGLFNCIPIAILDGKKIWKWGKGYWFLIVSLLITEFVLLLTFASWLYMPTQL
ncbi:MAG: hypothetical protein EAX96_08295 [Candidatus Lokiarchaeota archaeon]|nr:hypothetical protein [Candidatus Lokiarchaeota archaeon]